jgi:hypothetical protein
MRSLIARLRWTVRRLDEVSIQACLRCKTCARHYYVVQVVSGLDSVCGIYYIEYISRFWHLLATLWNFPGTC